MREILFRGKQVNGSGWVKGDLRQVEGKFYILDYDIGDDGVSESQRLFNIAYDVDPETVGQFTGLTDKNGTKIFENDIVRCWGGEYCQGYWEHDSNITVLDAYSIVEMSESENIEIIKDIHDNPNLLGGDNS